MPTQLHFIVKKWREQVAADPGLAKRQPYKAAADGDLAWLGVIGSSTGLVYVEDESGGDVLYGASFSFLDDGPEKPARIWSRIVSVRDDWSRVFP
jgi:hypothetical protein